MRSQRPPKYSSGIHYENKNLLKSLKLLKSPTTSKEAWLCAYKIASVIIVAAHNRKPWTAEIAYINLGIVALGASRASKELKYGDAF